MRTTNGGPRCPTALLFGAAVLLALVLPGPTHAGEAYYMVVFASRRVPNNPNYSHTFATFVRTTWPGNGPCRGPVTFEAHTISWLPVNGRVRVNALLSEPGRNFGLHETIRWALASGQRVSLWGPYPIKPELYRRALRRIAELESGRVRYKADDIGRRFDRVSNCIHAVGAISGLIRLRVAVTGWGQVASYAVLPRLERWILDRDRTHDWGALALRLDAYPIYYRNWVPPASGAFLGPVFRLFGGERDLEATYGPPAYRQGPGRHR